MKNFKITIKERELGQNSAGVFGLLIIVVSVFVYVITNIQ